MGSDQAKGFHSVLPEPPAIPCDWGDSLWVPVARSGRCSWGAGWARTTRDTGLACTP